MDRQHQMLTEREDQENHMNEGKTKDVHLTKQGAQSNPAPSSSSSSPSHEFSFTISLNPKIPENKSKAPPPLYPAIDLSPADEIFFHGHLLPLHLLSHLQTISPRSSTQSLDSFALPLNKVSEKNTTSSSNTSQENTLLASKGRQKSKSFSLFGLPRRRKQQDAREKQGDRAQGQKWKLRFDVSRVLKRYMRLVKPLLVSFRNKRRPDSSHSFSGNLRMKSEKGWRGRRGAFSSAPASMSVSPTNSGILVASGSVTPTTKNDSTMEELQAAIQAAIAHCKNSIAQHDHNQAPIVT